MSADPRHLHVLTTSFPTPRSSDLSGSRAPYESAEPRIVSCRSRMTKLSSTAGFFSSAGASIILTAIVAALLGLVTSVPRNTCRNVTEDRGRKQIDAARVACRSEEHKSELQSLMRN